MRRVFLVSWVCEVGLRLEVNIANVFMVWYCVRSILSWLVTLFIVLICVVLLIWEIDILMSMVGCMLVLKRLDCKKI